MPLARLVYGKARRAPHGAAPDAKPLPPNPLPERMDFRGAVRAELPLDDWCRDRRSLPAAPLFSVTRGRTVMLALAQPRPTRAQRVHLHGHHVRLLDALDDGWKPFWLDTILCAAAADRRASPSSPTIPASGCCSRALLGGDGRQSVTWFEVT